MDFEGNKFMVNGQRLKVFLEEEKVEVNNVEIYEFKEVRKRYHDLYP